MADLRQHLNTERETIMRPNNENFLIDLERAFEAAERGDYRDAERWTGLAERKVAMIRRGLDSAGKAGLTPKMIETLVASRTSPASD